MAKNFREYIREQIDILYSRKGYVPTNIAAFGITPRKFTMLERAFAGDLQVVDFAATAETESLYFHTLTGNDPDEISDFEAIRDFENQLVNNRLILAHDGHLPFRYVAGRIIRRKHCNKKRRRRSGS